MVLKSPETLRSEHLTVGCQCLDSQPTPACQGLGSLEMIILEPVSGNSDLLYTLSCCDQQSIELCEVAGTHHTCRTEAQSDKREAAAWLNASALQTHTGP